MPYVRFNVNKDWLDEFGMTEPKTIAEYEAFFQAVLDNKPGVVPLFISRKSAEQINLLMGAFDMLTTGTWLMTPLWATGPTLLSTRISLLCCTAGMKRAI